MHAMLLASANEAAYAIGESVGVNAGHDYNWFIEQMNSRCKELGGENSNLLIQMDCTIRIITMCKRYGADWTGVVQTSEFSRLYRLSIIQFQPARRRKNTFSIKSIKCFSRRIQLLSIYNRWKDWLYIRCVVNADYDGGQWADSAGVCVVLRTHGKNIYPDTTNLFEYAFNNFTKVDVTTQEKSEDIETFLTEDGQSEPNYVDVAKMVWILQLWIRKSRRIQKIAAQEL